MEDRTSLLEKETCRECGNVGLLDGDDGFFYCHVCGCQAQDIVDAAIPDEDFVGCKGRAALYSARHSRRVFPPKPPQPTTTIPDDDFSLGSPTANALSLLEYCHRVRMSYAYGIQLMINLQCEALVDKFNVNPLICGISGAIWLRFLRFTRLFDDEWANQLHSLHRSQIQGNKKMKTQKPGAMHEPCNKSDRRMVLLWYRALRKRLPLSCSLAITYLCCHVAREPVLSTDIQRWTLEGKLPYLAAFVEIENTIKFTSECPLTADRMFRPLDIVPWNKLISSAAEIAQSVGLNLPSVNFYGIASRYLKYLSLPVEKILPFACLLNDWSVHPGLWLSTSEAEGTLPPRVIVMSILIVAIRILYNLNGLGKWEASLSDDSPGANHPPSALHKLEHEASQVLRILENKCVDSRETCDHSKDLPTYLRYCKDVVFAGSKPSSEDFMEGKLIKKLWEFYLTSSKDSEACASEACAPEACTSKNVNLSREIGVKWMKQHMEENRFCYIPPRNKNVKQDEYIRYTRKREDGMLLYPVPADYYILLYACAREAQVDARIMHHGVTSLEKRLSQIETRIDAIFT